MEPSPSAMTPVGSQCFPPPSPTQSRKRAFSEVDEPNVPKQETYTHQKQHDGPGDEENRNPLPVAPSTPQQHSHTTVPQAATKKQKLSPNTKEAKRLEKEEKDRIKLEEKAKKDEEKRIKDEERKKKEAEREEEKKKRDAEREEERKRREEKKKAKEEEKNARDEEKRKKEEEKVKKERVSITRRPMK